MHNDNVADGEVTRVVALKWVNLSLYVSISDATTSLQGHVTTTAFYSDDVLYLRADESNRSCCIERRMVRLRPHAERSHGIEAMFSDTDALRCR
jgi:hypothetical protein